MRRASTPPVPVHDVAVTSVSAPLPVLTDINQTVTVEVANQGNQTETFDVSLSDSLAATIPSTLQAVVSLAAGASETLNFSWTPTVTGDHVLTATASTVDGEVDTEDNSMSATLAVRDPVHDVAVAFISAPPSVTQGNTADIFVIVTNEGDFEETFNVMMTDTPPSGGTAGSVSALQPVTLAAGALATLTFTWDTTNGSTGTHTLTATADTLPEETDTADNEKSTTSQVNVPSVGVAVTGIVPNSMQAGSSVVVAITGSGFVAGASVTFENGNGPAPTTSDVFVVDANTLIGIVTAKSGGPRRDRLWDVRVTNPDGSTGVLLDGLTVTP